MELGFLLECLFMLVAFLIFLQAPASVALSIKTLQSFLQKLGKFSYFLAQMEFLNILNFYLEEALWVLQTKIVVHEK